MTKLLKIILKERPFLTRELCRDHYLRITQGENSEIQNAVFSKQTTLPRGAEESYLNVMLAKFTAQIGLVIRNNERD